MPILFNNPDSKFSPQFFTALGAGLLSGNTWNEQLANAGLGAQTAMATQQQKQQEQATKNQTVSLLQAASPELANAVAAGTMTPADAYNAYLKQKQEAAAAAKPAFVKFDDGSYGWVNPSTKAVDIVGTAAKPDIPTEAKTQQYWSAHPVEYQDMMKRKAEEEKLKAQPTPADTLKSNLETMTTYRNDPTVKNFVVSRDAYQKVRTSAQLGTAQGDIGLVYGFMKMLDPTSVVREGEYATAQNSGGVSDTVINLYNKVLNGTRLTPEQRQQFVEAAGKQYDTVASDLKAVNSRYSDIVTPAGIDPTKVFEQPKAYEPLTIGQPSQVVLPSGKKATITRVPD